MIKTVYKCTMHNSVTNLYEGWRNYWCEYRDITIPTVNKYLEKERLKIETGQVIIFLSLSRFLAIHPVVVCLTKLAATSQTWTDFSIQT